MQSVKRVMREVMPTILLRVGAQVFNRQPTRTPLFIGNYDTWEEASAQADAWSDESFASHAQSTAHRARRGEIAFERDARPAKELQWPVIATLNKFLAEQSKHLRLLDFGGSLGSLYYQSRPHLASDSIVEWRIVEQEKLRGLEKQNFKTTRCSFSNLSQKSSVGIGALMLYSCPGRCNTQRDAYEILKELLALGAEYFVLDRTTFISDNHADRITVQHITEMNYGRYLRLPQWLFNPRRFADILAKSSYEIVADFDAVDPTVHLSDCSVPHRGLVAKRRSYEHTRDAADHGRVEPHQSGPTSPPKL